jgi:hypothetical protein
MSCYIYTTFRNKNIKSTLRFIPYACKYSRRHGFTDGVDSVPEEI